jgi:hypothetical protein
VYAKLNVTTISLPSGSSSPSDIAQRVESYFQTSKPIVRRTGLRDVSFRPFGHMSIAFVIVDDNGAAKLKGTLTSHFVGLLNGVSTQVR